MLVRKLTAALSLMGLWLCAAAAAGVTYTVRDKTVLNADIQDSLSTVQLHASNQEGVQVVFNDILQQQLFLFIKSNGSWHTKAREVPFFTQSGFLLNHDKSQLYTIANTPVSGGRMTTSISIYPVNGSDADLRTPDIMLTIPSENREFAGEMCKKGSRLFEASDGRYLLQGTCTQAKKDPLALIGTVISGGHAGFAEWPFLAELTVGGETVFRKWPVSYGTNEVFSVSDAVLSGSKLHLVGLWGKEYMPSRRRVEYSCFELETGVWSRPQVVYREESQGSLLSACSILENNGRILVAWAACPGSSGPGVYLRSEKNGQWSEILKLTSSADRFLFVEDGNGNPCIFWRVDGHGIFFRVEVNGNWGDVQLLLADDHMDTNMPWDLGCDNKGNLHIIVFRKNRGASDPGSAYKVYNPLYLCFERTE